MTSSQYCYTHNPDIAEEEKQQGRIRGGEVKVIAIDKPLLPVKINTSRDITTLLEKTINEVRTGELDPRIANTIGYLAGVMLKAQETTEVGDRLSKIQEVIGRD